MAKRFIQSSDVKVGESGDLVVEECLEGLLAELRPYRTGFDVTPSDSADLATPTRGISVGTAGNVKMTLAGSGTVTRYMEAHIIYPLAVARVWATGTTAASIAGWA